MSEIGKGFEGERGAALPSVTDGVVELRRKLFGAASKAYREDRAYVAFTRMQRAGFFDRLLNRVLGAARQGLDQNFPAIPDGMVTIPIASLLPGTAYLPFFDGNFRPRGRRQKKTWIRAFLAFDPENHQPVTVRAPSQFELAALNLPDAAQAGVRIVVDGHYTVSVARALGVASLRVEFAPELSGNGAVAPLASSDASDPAARKEVAEESESVCASNEVCA